MIQFFFFNVDHFKVFIEFVTILFLSSVLLFVTVFSVFWFGFWLRGIWDLNSQIRDSTHTVSIGR